MMSYLVPDMTFVSDLFYTVLLIFFSTFWYDGDREKPKHYINKEGKKEQECDSKQRGLSCQNRIFSLTRLMQTTIGGFLFPPKSLTKEIKLKATQMLFPAFT